MSTNADKAKRVAIGALVVGIIGYVAGILTAPKSGKQTRNDIANARDKSIAEAEKQLKRLHSELNHLIGEAESYVKDGDSRHRMNEVIEGEVMTKATKVRQKTRELLSSLHDGNSDDDRELDRAITEASKAVQAVRRYLKK